MTQTTLLEESNTTMAARHFAWRLRFETDPSDVMARLDDGTAAPVPVDTRPAEEFARGHLPAAISLPLDRMTDEALASLDRSKTYVTYAADPACNGATRGAMNLAAAGLVVQEMIGGFEYWIRAGLPTEDGLA